MKLFYAMGLLTLFFALLLLKKNNKKSNILISIVYASGILYFYNILISLVLTTINIKNTLFIYFIIYLLTAAILTFINYKKNKKIKYQKFYLDKKQLIVFIIILCTCLTLGFIRTNGFIETNYIVNDAATHHKMAKDYAHYQKLLYIKEYSDEFYNFGHTMPGFYVDCGIFMQIMPTSTYVAYNIFNTLILCLLSLTFYVTCLKIKKSDKNNIITLIITMLYTLAYPLNYFIYGFGYLGPGILACNLIFLTWYLLDDNYHQNKSLYIYLSLFNFGLFFTYYLFVPVVFFAQALYMIFNYMTQKYTFKELCKYAAISLIIPTIIGACFFLLANSNQAGVETITKGYKTEGYLYRNLWGNFILLIPLVVYSFITSIKNKKINLEIFLIVVLFAFLVFTLYLTAIQKISSYYYYKPYYLLWLISYIFIAKIISNKDKQFTLFFRISIGFIITMIALSVWDIETTLYLKNPNITFKKVSTDFVDIYQHNLNEWKTVTSISKSDIKLIDSATKNKKKCGIKEKSSELPVKAEVIPKTWFYSITDIVPVYLKNDEGPKQFIITGFNYEKMKEDKNIKCMIIFYRYNKKESGIYDEINYDEYKTLYKNKSGILLMKK